MASLELTRLWKLHEIDELILKLQKQAAALDGGKKFMEAAKKLEVDLATHAYKIKHAEHTDLNLLSKSLDDKLKKLDKQLFGGTVTSTREADAFAKEIESTKRQRDETVEKVLVIEDALGPLKVAYDEVEKKLGQYQAAAKKAHAEAVVQQKQMQADYAEAVSKRPEVAKTISPAVLARYDGLRKKLGTGMARIKASSCSACGMNLPEKSLQGAREDKVVTCEACHRILYFHEGL